MARRENAVAVSLNRLAECVSGRRPGASWRRWGLSEASAI